MQILDYLGSKDQLYIIGQLWWSGNHPPLLFNAIILFIYLKRQKSHYDNFCDLTLKSDKKVPVSSPLNMQYGLYLLSTTCWNAGSRYIFC